MPHFPQPTDKEKQMALLDDMETLADECLCHECSTPLTEDEQQMGFVCSECIHAWSQEAMHEY
jgi:hypothetical protein